MPHKTSKTTTLEEVLSDANAQPQKTTLWPNGYEIPVLWLIGGPGTGKTTFGAAMSDIPGARITILDIEGSTANIRKQHGIEVIDVRQRIAEKLGRLAFNYTNLQLFETVLEIIESHEGGDVLAIDPVSKIYMGSNEYTKKHPEIFNKTEANYQSREGTKYSVYRGREGAQYSWGDTAILWQNLLSYMTAKWSMVILNSHPKDRYEKYTDATGQQASRKTGEQTFRGIDFGELSTLTLWLARDSHDPKTPANMLQTGRPGGLWARVVKDRIPHAVNVTKEMLCEQGLAATVDEIADDDPRLGYKIGSLLPTALIPAPMQPYHQLIASFMRNPRLDYGELNKLVYDPAKEQLSEEEKKLLDLSLSQTDREREEIALKREIAKQKRALADTLIQAGHYPDAAAIGAALAELGLEYDITRHEEILAKLVAYANQS